MTSLICYPSYFAVDTGASLPRRVKLHEVCHFLLLSACPRLKFSSTTNTIVQFTESSTRPSFTSKPSFQQGSQMGNFRHQSIRADERGDGDKDRERGDRDSRSYRERDRDRDGHERLRTVSLFRTHLLPITCSMFAVCPLGQLHPSILIFPPNLMEIVRAPCFISTVSSVHSLPPSLHSLLRSLVTASYISC